FTTSSDSSWLFVTPAGGAAPQSLQVSAIVGTLTAGSYTGHITITAAGAQNSPAIVTVTFGVAAPTPQLPVSPTALSFSGTQGSSANPSPGSLNVANS